MTRDENPHADRLLDRAVEAVRADVPRDVDVEAAARRAWARIVAAAPASGVPLTSCADFQSLAAGYVAGTLEVARARLLEDHVAGCAPCRRSLEAARAGEAFAGSAPIRAPLRDLREVAAGAPGRAVSRLPRPWRRVRPLAWAAAAAISLAVGLAATSALGLLPFGPTAALAHVESVDGALYRVDGGSVLPMEAGAAVASGDTIRSAAGGRAVLRLADGSLIEMDDRSGLRLGRRPGRTTVDLERGRVIVRASEQGRGRLAVSTSDCVATVQGTLFAVSSGAAGSRVSVLSGEVQVAEAGGASTLGPGDQLVTGAGLRPVDLHDEVSWSHDAEAYRVLIAELSELQGEVRAAFLPGGRTESRLLGLVPGEVDLYLAMPNVGRALAESGLALDRRLAESDALRSWWDRAVTPSGAESDMRAAIDRLEPFGEALGDEIVVAARVPRGDEAPAVVLLAEVRDAEALDAALAAEGDALGAEMPRLQLRRGADILIASTDPDLLRDVEAAAAGEGTGFAASPFGLRVAEAYERGVDWLVAVDMERGLLSAMAGAEAAHGGTDGGDAPSAESLSATGMLDARFLIVAQTGIDGGARTDAALSFDGARRGLAAWLAEPGPMGALRFVSSDAVAAAAFVVADPAVMLADVRAMMAWSDPEWDLVAGDGDEAEAMEIVEDIAAALGGDMAFALDGPVLPVPSWVAAVEVYDPDGLRRAVEAAIALRNRQAQDPGAPVWALRIESSASGERWALDTGRPGGEVFASIADGYLVVARSQALVERALRTMRSGASLATADLVRDTIRRDGNLDVSALFYQDFAGSVEELAGGVVEGVLSGAATDPAVAEALRQLAPTVLTVVAKEDEIRVQGDGPAGLLGLPFPGGGGALGLLPLLPSVPSRPGPASPWTGPSGPMVP